jgi:hypothetical protein
MPIGPETLLNILDTEDKILYDTLVQEIDKELKNNFVGSLVTTVSISRYPNVRVQLKLRNAYLQAGWHEIKFEDAQIDGPWVELKWKNK